MTTASAIAAWLAATLAAAVRARGERPALGENEPAAPENTTPFAFTCAGSSPTRDTDERPLPLALPLRLAGDGDADADADAEEDDDDGMLSSVAVSRCTVLMKSTRSMIDATRARAKHGKATRERDAERERERGKRIKTG